MLACNTEDAHFGLVGFFSISVSVLYLCSILEKKDGLLNMGLGVRNSRANH